MYQRRTAGQWSPISARAWNASMAAAEAHEQRVRSQTSPDGDRDGPGRSYVTIRNATGSNMRRGAVLGLSNWTFNPAVLLQHEEAQATCCLNAVAPTEDHAEQFVVLPEELLANEVGPAVLSGVVLVRVNITNADHEYCTITPGDTTGLTSDSTGRGRIIAREGSTGLQWCIVELARAAASPGGSTTTIISFTATADRNPSSTTFAAVANYFLSGTDPTLGMGPGNTFTAHDEDFSFPRILDGAIGIAVWDQEEEHYKVITCQQMCILALAQINASGGMVGSEVESVTIDGFEVMSPMPFGMPPDPLPTTAVNLHKHLGQDNFFVTLAWDETNEQWLIIDVEKDHITLVTDVRIDSGYLQAKEIEAAIEVNDPAGAWVNKIQTTTCPPPP